MLGLLHIENIALIESAEIEFHPGLNVLTGETGAGKSIVLDSISAVIGERTSRDILRTGAKSATVSAFFRDLPALAWFTENGIFPDEDGQLTLQRRLTADGRNVCRVNGEPVALAQLRDLGQSLVNIHGQHDSQQLLNEEYHLYYLDLFAECGAEKSAYQGAYEALCALRRRIEALNTDEAAKARRIENLQYQIDELEAAGLTDGEEERLNERRNILKNAGRIADALAAAHEALSGGEDSDGATALLYGAADALAALNSLGEPFHGLSQRLEELKLLADDLAADVRDLNYDLEFSPAELDEIESRLDRLHRLKKKYGATVADMLVYLEQCKTELDEIEQSGDLLQRLEQQRKIAAREAGTAAQALHEVRAAAALRLTARILTELEQLDMGGVRFAVDMAEQPLDESGMDSVRFLLSANLGEDLKPIDRVASGGELARVMLAMKNVLSEKDAITTLIFDEADSGVSGRAAGRVAEKLAAIGRTKQVFCVTHLPLTAAMADTQFLVEKSQRDGRTYTSVTELDRAGRRQELARLTVGDNITETALSGAEELLRTADRIKTELR